ncbi:MAG: 50S ribosomal protein L39e [Promethearchaeota archaeon]
MARNKSLPMKLRLGKSKDQSGNIPTWVTVKTQGKIRTTPYSRRHWRSQRLKK